MNEEQRSRPAPDTGQGPSNARGDPADQHGLGDELRPQAGEAAPPDDLPSLAAAVLAYTERALRLEPSWRVAEGGALTWWGHGLAQRITAEPPRATAGREVVALRVTTDVLRALPDSADAAEAVENLNRQAHLSSWLHDRAAGTLTLACTIYAHAGNVAWLQLLLVQAAAIQAADAHAKATWLPGALGAEAAISEHPESGPRAEASDMLNVMHDLYATAAGPSPFDAALFTRIREAMPAPWLSVTAAPSGAGLDATLATGGGAPARLTVRGAARHAALGSGAAVHLALPLPAGMRAAAAAERLNAAEVAGWTGFNLLGGWCVTEDLPELEFRTFLPARICWPGLLESFLWTAAARCRWAAAQLA